MRWPLKPGRERTETDLPAAATARPPAASQGKAPAVSDAGDIAAFLDAARTTAPYAAGRRGRLIFALDATMSRQPTWDRATVLQAEMFNETARTGGLDVQLVYFRGLGECRSSRFVADPRALSSLMERIACRGGHTQIGKVLSHALATTREAKVDALVYVGDAMEEAIDDLAARAGELGLLGVKAFLFQEGHDPVAERAFREIARLTGGAYARFDASSSGRLAMLLRAVAAYAAGGHAGLDRLAASDGAARMLLSQMGAR